MTPSATPTSSPRPRGIVRTVQFWRLVNSRTKQAVEEQDWHSILRDMGTAAITHRILKKELTCSVVALDISSEWDGLLPPTGVDNLVQAVHDDATYGVVVATDKDHVPSQGKRGTGEQKPVTIENGFSPIDNLFVWFLPFGNIFGVLMETQSSARPQAFASWLTRVMRDQGTLTQHNFEWGVVPVIDAGRRDALARAQQLKSIYVADTISPSAPSPLKDLLAGPSFEGAYKLEIKLRPVKSDGKSSFEDDTKELRDWLDSTFGADYAVLDAAQVQFHRHPGDDLPNGIVNLLEHKLTRKRTILMQQGSFQSFSALSALSEIVRTYTLEFDELLKLR